MKVFCDGHEVENVIFANADENFVRFGIPKTDKNYKWESESQGTESPTGTMNGAITFHCSYCNGVAGVNAVASDCEECGAVGSMHVMNNDLIECCECGHCEQNWIDCPECKNF